MPKHADHGLTAEQLDDKYNPEGGGEHPQFPREQWRWHVDAENTLLGYWDWVEHQITEWEDDGGT